MAEQETDMTKKLDTEVKAMFAIQGALSKLDERAQVRVLDYFHARAHGTSQATVRNAMLRFGLTPAESTG